MKELLKDSFESNKVEIVEEEQQKKELKLIGQQRKMPGLTLWEYNEKTKVLEKAKYKPGSVFISSMSDKIETTKTYILVVNENCVYFQALNQKNAARKLNKLGYV